MGGTDQYIQNTSQCLFNLFYVLMGASGEKDFYWTILMDLPVVMRVYVWKKFNFDNLKQQNHTFESQFSVMLQNVTGYYWMWKIFYWNASFVLKVKIIFAEIQ